MEKITFQWLQLYRLYILDKIFYVCMFLTQSCLTLCNPMDDSLPGSSVHEDNFPSKDTGVGCHFLIQGIFPTQGLNQETDALSSDLPGKPQDFL